MDPVAALVALGSVVVIGSIALVWRARAESGDREPPSDTERLPLHDRLAPLVGTDVEQYPARRGARRRRHRDGLVAGVDGSIQHDHDAMDERQRPPAGA